MGKFSFRRGLRQGFILVVTFFAAQSLAGGGDRKFEFKIAYQNLKLKENNENTLDGLKGALSSLGSYYRFEFRDEDPMIAKIVRVEDQNSSSPVLITDRELGVPLLKIVAAEKLFFRRELFGASEPMYIYQRFSRYNSEVYRVDKVSGTLFRRSISRNLIQLQGEPMGAVLSSGEYFAWHELKNRDRGLIPQSRLVFFLRGLKSSAMIKMPFETLEAMVGLDDDRSLKGLPAGVQGEVFADTLSVLQERKQNPDPTFHSSLRRLSQRLNVENEELITQALKAAEQACERFLQGQTGEDRYDSFYK